MIGRLWNFVVEIAASVAAGQLTPHMPSLLQALLVVLVLIAIAAGQRGQR